MYSLRLIYLLFAVDLLQHTAALRLPVRDVDVYNSLRTREAALTDSLNIPTTTQDHSEDDDDDTPITTTSDHPVVKLNSDSDHSSAAYANAITSTIQDGHDTSSTHSSSGSHLSTAARVGIAVGIILGVLSMVAAAVATAFWESNRRHRRNTFRKVGQDEEGKLPPAIDDQRALLQSSQGEMVTPPEESHSRDAAESIAGYDLRDGSFQRLYAPAPTPVQSSQSS